MTMVKLSPLHADDMGRNPPATIALSYYLGGKKNHHFELRYQ